jgi:hypothetical protein
MAPALVVLFFALMVAFAIVGRQRPWKGMRSIPAFSKLVRMIALAVEDGTRLHLSLGRGDVTSSRSAASFVGLSILGRVSRIASISDRPPIASVGEGALAILARDTMLQAYRDVGATEEYDPTVGRLTGITPFSYAIGATPAIQDEGVSVNVITGNFGSEVALIADAIDRGGGFSLAGSDNISTQAILYATADEPLIGEELYAGGAYLRAGLMHTSSLRAQDIIRWLIVASIIGGGVYKLIQGFLL